MPTFGNAHLSIDVSSDGSTAKLMVNGVEHIRFNGPASPGERQPVPTASKSPEIQYEVVSGQNKIAIT